MRSISTLLLLFITVFVSAQSVADKVVISIYNGNQKIVDTVPKAAICKVVPNNELTGKVIGLNIPPKPADTKKKTAGVFLRCGRSATAHGQPLLVVDGELAKLSSLRILDPSDIDSVWVLKRAVATALYGSEGYNGVVIISTKKTNTFIIKDLTDGVTIPGATVLFTSLKDKNEKHQFIANDSGIVTTKKLNRSGRYEMTISAAGYITRQDILDVHGRERKISLNRAAKICEEVIVKAYTTRKTVCYTGSCTLWCVCSGLNITAGSDKEEAVIEPLTFKIYPNPVQKGASLSLQFNNADEKEKMVRVLSLDGRILLQQNYTALKGKNIVRLTVDTRWAAGTYFVQLLYENGRVLASEKMIVQ